jgi:glycosyltransferase involved in cell wall biosynthesis
VNLDGVTGIEAPNRDVDAFAEAIDRLLTDEALAKTYAEAAHQRVAEHFTVSKMMEEMEKCYQELNSNVE